MNDVIRLLPDSVANQIAAGEVIQQPSSVIKELVENSVDAGAKHITVVIKDAGRTLIQVIDDGCGMSETDARLAFERHATSKIRRVDDLFALSTMGFRGEALASIAAVAQVELRTRRADDEVGTKLCISGSRVTSQEPDVCPVGSNMAVKNLFYNVTVRRKFLKKDSTELSNIVREFERLALVNPDVELTLIHNDVTLHRLSPSTLKQRIRDLFGKSVDGQLIPVETETSIVKIKGYIGSPENARRKGALQYLMVNGRNMRHPVFHKAVMQCYEPLLLPDAKPNFFLQMTVDPETIDVNIHPTKNEIKFENEAAIRQILVAAIRESMGRYNLVASIDFNTAGRPEIPPFMPDASVNLNHKLDAGYTPFQKEHNHQGGSSYGRPDNTFRSRTADWEKLYADFKRDASSNLASTQSESSSTETLPGFDADNFGAIVPGAFQLKDRYIITVAHDGLLVVDQRRAHVNVLYGKFLEAITSETASSQTLLFPESLELSAAQNVLMSSVADKLHAVGFDTAYLGNNAWSINAVPALLADANAADTLMRLLEQIENTDMADVEALHRGMALGMARAGAIRHGQSLSQGEIEHLLSDLYKLPSPGRLPDGKPVFATITLDSLASLLG